MAFVSATPLTSSIQPSQSIRRELSTTPLRSSPKTTTSSSNVPRMGYGAYSYLTDKTKGHVNQYYVDKFRNVYDFAKGPPGSEQDSVVGLNMKGAVDVPTEGIPQLDASYSALVPIDEDATPDPRIAESEGAPYPWDPLYVNPEFLPSTYADTTSDIVSDDAFAKFRGMTAIDRGESLSALDFGANHRINQLTSEKGLNERYILCQEGQHNANYVKLQKLGYPALLNPTGIPQTEIPGYNYLPNASALDFVESEEKEIAFWKQELPKPKVYKTPAGNEMPELPYNTSPSIPALKEAQEARDIIPKE